MCILDSRQPMSNNDRRSALGDIVKRLLDRRFVRAVQSASRLIKEENLWVLEDRACYTYSLFLSAGKLAACIADVHVQSLLHLANKLPGICLLQRVDHLFLCCAFVAIEQVLTDRCREKNRLLPNISDMLAEGLEIHGLEFVPINSDASLIWVVKALQHLHDRGLATARLANQSCLFVFLELQINALQHWDIQLHWVAKKNILELEVALDVFNDHALRVVNDQWLVVEDLEQPASCLSPL